jgi:hypothetical protein
MVEETVQTITILSLSPLRGAAAKDDDDATDNEEDEDDAEDAEEATAFTAPQAHVDSFFEKKTTVVRSRSGRLCGGKYRRQ